MRERGIVREWFMDRNYGVIARTGQPDVVVQGGEVKHGPKCLAGHGQHCFLGAYLPLNSLVEYEVSEVLSHALFGAGQLGLGGQPEAVNVRMVDADGADLDLSQIERPKYPGVVPACFRWTQNLHEVT
jgi:hypothetical protein